MKEKNKAAKDAFFKQEGGSLIFQFHRLHNSMFRLANKMIDESSVPLKMEQLPVLMVLYWLEEQSQQQVADRIHRDKSSVLRTVLALEKKGLITNKKDKKDKRRKVLTLTQTGEFVAIQVNDLIKEIEQKIINSLTELPREEFLEILETAVGKLEKARNS